MSEENVNPQPPIGAGTGSAGIPNGPSSTDPGGGHGGYGLPPSLHRAGTPDGVPTVKTPSDGGGNATVEVPNVVGLHNVEAFRTLTVTNLRPGFFYESEESKNARERQQELRDAGKDPGPVTGPRGSVLFVNTEDEVTPGTVISQAPQAGTLVPAHSDVTLNCAYADEKKSRKGLIIGLIVALLVVILGVGGYLFVSKANQTSVPNVVQTNLTEATSKLQAANLKLGTVTKQKQKGPVNVVLSQDPVGGVSVKKDTAVNLVISEEDLVAVPNVVGLQLAAANQEITQSGFVTGTLTRLPSQKPAGTVIAQSPTSSSNLVAGGKISLTVSTGADKVPSVVGMTVEKASQTLVNEGLVVNPVYVVTTSAAPGVVVSQSPQGGSTAPDGTTVTINIAKAPTPKPTPTVTVTPTPTPTATITVSPKPEPTPTTIVTVTP